MAKKTPQAQPGLPGIDSRPAAAPRRPANDPGATTLAAPRPRAAERRLGAREAPVNQDYQDACPWVPMTPEEVLEFEARFGCPVVKGWFRFELRGARETWEQREGRAARVLAGGRLVPVWRVRFAR
jgi:hypothetical protein